jgi:hypothetical protein
MHHMNEALTAWRQHLELKQLLADIRLDLLRLEYLRKYRPDQPRDDVGHGPPMPAVRAMMRALPSWPPAAGENQKRIAGHN